MNFYLIIRILTLIKLICNKSLWEKRISPADFFCKVLSYDFCVKSLFNYYCVGGYIGLQD